MKEENCRVVMSQTKRTVTLACFILGLVLFGAFVVATVVEGSRVGSDVPLSGWLFIILGGSVFCFLLAFILIGISAARIRVRGLQVSTTVPAVQPTENFSIWLFLKVVANGAMGAVGLFLTLLLISLVIGKTTPPPISEFGFNIIILVLGFCLFGGLLASGAYVRRLWKHAQRVDVLRGVVIGALLGGVYIPFLWYVIIPLLSKALHIPYSNAFATNPVGAVFVGVVFALCSMGLGYMIGKDAEQK